MSKSKRRNNARLRGREKCPRCGSKSTKILNSDPDEFIMSCTRPSCQAKWHKPRDTNIRLRLKEGDIKYVKKKEELPKEDKSIMVNATQTPSDLVDLGSISIGRKN